MRWSPVVLSLVLFGCTADPLSAAWQVRLGEGVVERSLVVVVFITEGPCPPTGLALYREEVRLGLDAAAPPRLSPGTYCFAARAQDAACLWFAGGERTVELPLETDVPVEIVVEAIGTPTPACSAEECDSGICAAMDAGMSDAGPSDGDGGPPGDDAGADGGPGDDAAVDAGGPCSSSSDCGSTQACYAGLCLETCRTELYDPDCPSGTVCSLGLCWPRCVRKTCPGSLLCGFDGFCLPEFGCTPGKCPSSLTCDVHPVERFCWFACRDASDCAGHLRCRTEGPGTGYCGQACGTASDCPTGAMCFMPLGGKGPLPGTCFWPCIDSGDCPSAAPLAWFCSGGVCVPD